MTTTPEYAKGGIVSGDIFVPNHYSIELVGTIDTHCRTGTDKLLPAIADGCMQCSDWHKTEIYKQMVLNSMQGVPIKTNKP